MRIATSLAAIAFLSACQSQPYSPVPAAILSAYPNIGFGTVRLQPLSKADANQLTVSDVRQILRLAQNRKDIRKPISAIYFTSAKHAEVTGARSKDEVTEFQVKKEHGVWRIIEGSVDQTRWIVH